MQENIESESLKGTAHATHLWLCLGGLCLDRLWRGPLSTSAAPQPRPHVASLCLGGTVPCCEQYAGGLLCIPHRVLLIALAPA